MPVDGKTHHAERIQSAISSNGAAKSALIASWQRSACLHKLDPARTNLPERLTDFEFGRARQEVEPLIQAAQPSLDRLQISVGGAGCCVLLADRNGVPVERRGAPGDDATFFDWGLWPGAIWSEDRAEMVENFVNLIATAVSDAAARIEAECFRLAYPDARILVAPPDKMGRALIAVDQDDLVVGASRAARLALGMSQACLQKPLPAAEVMNMSRTVTENLAAAERGVLQRALARAEGNVTVAAEALGMSRATFYRKLRRLDLHRTH